jgi:putative ABC transport system substrate-binding protein
MAMRRRAFIAALGSAAAWPLVARAQQTGLTSPTRRLGYLIGAGQDQTIQSTRDLLFRKLEQLGWTEGRNLAVERRFGEGDLARMRVAAKELVAMKPDVIFARRPLLRRCSLRRTQSRLFSRSSQTRLESVSSLAWPSREAT